MIIFGVDPGSNASGLAVIDCDSIQPAKYSLLALDCYETKKSDNFDAKLEFMGTKVLESLKEFTPDLVVLEDIFVGKNIQSSFRLAELRGVIRFLCAKEKIELISVPTRKVKKSITGNGNASKELVADFLIREFSLQNKQIPEDATDALALAVYQASFMAGSLKSPALDL